MKIEIEIPDDMTHDEIQTMRAGMQKEADEVIEKVYVNGKQFRDHLRKIRAKTLCKWHTETDHEALARHFGLGPADPSEEFHLLFHGTPFRVIDNDEE